MDPIPVVIADRHPLTRFGVRSALDESGQFAVVGETDCSTEALRLASSQQPELVVMGMNLSDPQTLAADLRDAGSRVLVLSGLEGERFLYVMLQQQVVGFLSKLEPRQALVRAVEAVASGGSGVISAPIVERLSRSSVALAEDPLSEREREVVCLIAQGLSNGHVAEALFLAPNTIKNHITSIFAKLEVSSRAEAIVWAWRHGLVRA